ncbi:enoyl-CoA hydratase [Gammaproteobacteria bacterium]|jgi:2-(1,2-epoxy-1,2-dihydrophenyl)acetyl-CoA isomerase|nr:enoyl-CoA hydratase [bacterium]MDA9783669.1 enoyl-CoA hydratase [Gammaproteobacteria bacterium]MDB2376027.1 enoyl-CoA hydratase [Gammaproteobacteria bacterium]
MSLTINTGTDELLCLIDDRVATITLNRPGKRNALSDRLTPALRRILLELDTRQDVGCIVITGAGSAFCAGGDISGMGAVGGDPSALEPTIQERTRALQHKHDTLTHRLFDHSKPTIAALPGVAAGAGFCIALACDIRIAAASAFVTTAYRNIGFSGDYGGSWLLNQLVGPARTKELFYTARRVQSDEALALGIFNQVVADEDFLTETMNLAKHIASGPPIALGYMKENINAATGCDLRTSLNMEADRLIRCAFTQDHKEAVTAFMAKRAPVFSGK